MVADKAYATELMSFVLQVEKLRGKARSMGIIVASGVIVFILAPSALFSYVESWTYGQSIYYTIISLATVGFGDITNEDSSEVKQKLGLWIWAYRGFVWLWLLFGLGFMTMGNSIVTEYFKKKSKKLRKSSLIPMTTLTSADERSPPMSTRSISTQTMSVGQRLVSQSSVESILSDDTLLSLQEFEHGEQMELLRRYEENRNSLWDNFGAEHEHDDFPDKVRQHLESQLVARKKHRNR